MDAADRAERMRARELFSELRAMPGAWLVVRMDGRGFSRLTREHFDKPFDRRFFEAMVEAATAACGELQGAFAYAQSDEISLVLPPQWELFDRRLEKLVSLSASVVTAAFCRRTGIEAQFDSRCWMGVSAEEVSEYVRWRAGDAARCAVSTAAYWALVAEGKTARQAHRALEGKGWSAKQELLHARGTNFNELPVWQRRGVMIRWESYLKEGYNPVTEERVEVERRRLGVNWEIPMKEELSSYVARLCQEAVSPSSAP